MINIVKQGIYRLIETNAQTKILILDGRDYFAWINAGEIGEILCFVGGGYKEQKVMAVGEYKLFLIKDEPKLTDLEHLEVQAGDNLWQGYLLPTGLPTAEDQKNRIIPTEELVNE